MSTPLSALPIRPLTMGDRLSCADLAENRGWPREERKWGLLLAAGTGYGIDDPDGKGLAACCVLTSYGPDLAAIGLLLVAEQHARQGLAQRLMAHVREAADGTPLSLYATSLGLPLYEKLGFTTVGRTETLRGQWRSPEPTGQAHPVRTRRATGADLPALVRLDTEVFGADRTHLVTRLPAFADQLQVAVDGPAITGYAARWPTSATDVIGPLIAPDTETAKALVSALADGTDRSLRLDVDARHQELLAWLTEHGLESVKGCTAMTYGVADLPGDRSRLFAVLNLATG